MNIVNVKNFFKTFKKYIAIFNYICYHIVVMITKKLTKAGRYFKKYKSPERRNYGT